MAARYDSIIDMPHHVSATRPQMPMAARAAQFAPFAALTGFGAAIRETGRLTERRRELDEDEMAAINGVLTELRESLDREPRAAIRYFRPDKRKAGGQYVTAEGAVKRIDELNRLILLKDGRRIAIDDITAIEIKTE